MTAPEGGSSVTMEELEAASKVEEAPKPVNLAEVKLEGEEIPEQLRGKSAAEAVAYAKQLEASLRISEDARKQAQTNTELAMRQPSAPPPVPTPEPDLSMEQLQELHEKNPLQAIAYMNDRAIRHAERNIEARLGPLFQGTAASVEQAARERYKEDFELFGDQITQIVGQLPGGKSALTNPQAWEDVVSLVRGRPGNLDRIVEKRVAKATGEAATAARSAQAEGSGIVMQSATRGATPSNSGTLDDTERQIMRELGINDEKEWIKWRNMG